MSKNFDFARQRIREIIVKIMFHEHFRIYSIFIIISKQLTTIVLSRLQADLELCCLHFA